MSIEHGRYRIQGFQMVRNIIPEAALLMKERNGIMKLIIFRK